MDDLSQHYGRVLEQKLKSLNNDFKRAYHPLSLDKKTIDSSPFPIAMYGMSILDLFSAYLEGNSKGDNTTRMID